MILAPNVREANGNTVNLHGPLLPQHLTDLRGSGLSDDQIARCGFHSLQTPAKIKQALRWNKYHGELGDCLAIPFVNRNGNCTPYCRLKPDRPRKAKGGKPVKYESPKGVPNQAFFPPSTLSALADPLTQLVVTEGEKKAAKADQEGFPCIGLVGVYGWQKKRAKDKDGGPQGDRELIPGLATIGWRDRPVVVCFDSDAATNLDVGWAEWRLAETLLRLGAIVRIVRLPQGEVGADGKRAKIGLDDFLVSNGPEAFRILIAAAIEAAPPERPLHPIEAADDPHRLARLFIEQRCKASDGVTLRHWRDEWYRWSGAVYSIVPKSELRAELTLFVKQEMDRLNLLAQRLVSEGAPPPEVRKVTQQLIANVLHALTSITILPSGIETPTWIGGAEAPSVGEILACRNGLVHLPSLGTNQNYILDPTPHFFSLNCLDFDFNLDAPKPTAWLEFLDKLWPDDPESIGTLQEWMGYLLSPDTSQHKILMLIGPRRSGKSTIGRIITALLGQANVAGPTLSSLGTNFGLSPLLSKTLAIISDARLSGRTDIATLSERLLSISGQDALTIDRKFLPAITAMLPTRFMLMTNELPRFGDASGALTGRFILLRLTQDWFGKEDRRLTSRLLADLPGILLWCIAGWQRLQNRGHFVQPHAGQELSDELEDLASPVGAFVRERCVVEAGRRVSVEELFNAWRAWCESKGRKDPGNEAMFGRDLRAAVPTIRKTRPREGTERYRAYEGIGLKD